MYNMEKYFLTHEECVARAEVISHSVSLDMKLARVKIYGIPRGGIPVTYLLLSLQPNYFIIVSKPEDADVFVDDIVDSGATAKSYRKKYGKGTYALVDKINYPVDKELGWIVFPWESKNENDDEEGVEENFKRVLQYYTPDCNRDGLDETPKRVSKAWDFWTSGYGQKPEDILKVFEDGADKYDEMVIVKDIPIYSKCEHHLADIFGTATIAYIPDGKIVGLSKLSRLANIYARRLQVQERMTVQIADAIEEHLKPKGVGVIIRARHMCMESRGICQQGHHTITSALRGVIKDDRDARNEFMLLDK